MQARIRIDCRSYDWQSRLEDHLKAGGEADLINFNFNLDGITAIEICERYRVEFRLSRNPELNEAEIRNPRK